VLKVEEEGGRMKIDTGFLRSSFEASTSMPEALVYDNPNPDAPPLSFDLDSDAISLVINSSEVGDTIYGVFTASYAAAREYGYEKEKKDGTTLRVSGDGFVMTNVAIWQDYVDEAVIEVRGSVEAQ